MRVVYIAAPVLWTMRFAAVEVYPREATGILFGETRGDEFWVHGAVPYAEPETRTRWATSADASEAKAREFFDHRVIGSFHSHPEWNTTLSKGTPGADFEEMQEGDVEVIVAVWPGKRKPWCFREGAYTRISEAAHRRVAVRVV